ncbi:serine/arginine repetitive matrix protein 1-like [Branchiostoma floridae]|uniref:Serine/arginine repetitive matrix protein 1-like n=1 Tax=Branchiostoma floridae TaxID=7739 RepID=A0A9J7KNT3_BRAFL|nr:serine/arginine repetitive matrix protein 1-like [Branchiostoma floridae]
MGVMFYMMVSGEKPFIAPQHRFPLVRVDLYAKELSERRPKFNCMISKEAKRLAGELLELDPAKRPTLRQVGCGVFSWTYFVLDPNQVVYIALAHKRKYEKLRRAGKGETVAGDQGETDPEPLFIHRTYDFMEETPAPLRSTPELVHRKYSDKCEALIINHRTKPRDAEANVNTSTRKVQDDASHADSDRSGNVDADLSTRKRRGRDASHADRSGNVDTDLSARKRRGRDASHAESDRSGNVDADLSARKRRGRDASHAESDRSGNVDADLSARKRRGRDASHADRSGNVDADLSARKRRGRDASHTDQSGNVDADLSDRKRRDRDASHADRSGNVDAGLSVRKRRGRDASHGDQSGNVDADLSDRKRRDRDASHADRSGNLDADLSARKRRGRRFIPMTQKDVENLMERNTFAPKPPSERKCVEADEVAPPSDHHPSSQMTKTQKDVGDLGAGFVPKPPPGKKSAGVAAPPPGQRPSSRAHIRKRERMESVSKREKEGELTANKTSCFRARVPSPGLTPPPECLDQVEPEEDVEPSYLEGSGLSVKLLSNGRKRIPMTKKDVGGIGPVPKPPHGKKSAGVAAPQSGQLQSSRAQIRKRESRVPQESVSKSEEDGKLTAKTVWRFKARSPSPCLTPPPECLDLDPKEDERKTAPMTQKSIDSLIDATTFTPKPPPRKKSTAAGMVARPSGQHQSSRASRVQITLKHRRVISPVGRTETVKFKDGFRLAHVAAFRWRSETLSPCLTPPPECLVQEEPAVGVLGDNGPGLKRSTPMRSQRHPDVGPREEERGDGEDGSERRSNIRGTKSRSDRDMKRTSRKSEGDVRSAMKRTEANVGQRKDESSTRKRGKSRSQKHNQDGAEADVAGGHALRKTSGRVLLPPVDAKQKKRLDGRARLPPINRRS